MRRASFFVSVSGQVVSGIWRPILISASITKSTDATSDTAQITLDDTTGTIRFPKSGDPIIVRIGWENGSAAEFEGEVDTPSWELDRGGGAVISITARSASLKGKEKEPRERHWEDKSIADALEDAASHAGISINVHSDFKSRILEWQAQQNESFLAFGQRMAREHGATFKVQGKRAGFVPRNAGVSASGKPLAPILVARRNNLISISGISPVRDRARFTKKIGRWYDEDEAKLKTKEIDADSEAVAKDLLRFTEGVEDQADWRAQSSKTESERQKGSGSIVLDGTPEAEPEAKANLVGVRPGIDGEYTIDSVDHQLDRGGGFTTTLSLANPEGSAGEDSR